MSSLVSWVQCNRCDKWRIVENADQLEEDAAWFCEMNPNSTYNSCSMPEEEVDEVKSPKRYIQSNKTPDPAPPPPKKAKTVSAEQEFFAMLKSWTTEQVMDYWGQIDWAQILELQRIHEPALPEFKNWTDIDDDEYVAGIDARMRASLPPRIAAQVPKLTSLRQQEAKLRAMLNQQ